MLSAAIGALGSLFGSSVGNNQAEAAASQAYERQKSLMKLQQDYAVSNWQREVNYNSPVEQMKRLKEAGLNPNLVYGNGSIQGLESPGISSPTSPSAPMASVFGFGNPIAEGAAAAQGIAAAKKAGAEAVGQTIENEYLTKTLSDRIKTVSVQNNWTAQQTSYLEEQIANLAGQRNIMSRQADLLKKEIDNYDEKFQAEMRQYRDQHHLDDENYKRLRDTYDDFKLLIKSQASEADWNSKIAQLTYESDKDFKNVERSLGAVGQVFKMLIKLIK